MKTLLAFSAVVLFAGAAQAQIVRVNPGDFHPDAGLITFSEYAQGTVNPVYAPANYGGGAGAPNVTFGGFFVGQALSANPGTDCPGAAASGCVSGSPTGPLTLDAASPNTFISSDGANPTSPVLSGSPTFNGPIAVLFDVDLAGVGFDGGFFDNIGSTGITAFARDGSLLGTVVNTGFGIEFLGLVTADGTPQIAGVFLNLVGAEGSGFAIDNLRFAQAGQITVPGGVPEPATWAMLIAGFGLIGAATRRRVRTVSYAA
ncbi:PEPxxWA-CTERM sorting domain-containing protein [Sphingomonas flavalba]|uniref:PEPxxWA-CTERM sorting domain-containing protein n=1 Tax=Sphingomonas flavalba TaxID=2559804 RepID=UPI00109D9516|nr:PEPxxWA-CTERM sorting domain-containing protein [Sphingomonas flavalba]